jgi:glycosyltransferase involved in cell wall biosynthesis
MKLVMTLVVRDEADVVDSQLSYHLNAGVDFVLATDHDSQDGTTEILESYERDGVLRLFRVHGEMKDGEWRTRMARLAATDHAADWVINTDADEFWLPRAGSLEDVFRAIPETIGIFWALTCHFVPRPDDGALFAERMTARFSAQAPLNDPTSPYRPHAKVAHRADPDIVVWFGSHRVVSKRLAPLPGLHPADVFHFPFRSLEQYERKNVRRARGDKPLGQYVKGLQARELGTIEDVYRRLVVDDEALARGVESGALVIDTRLRDALRSGAGAVAVPVTGAAEDPMRFARDEAALRDADLVRLVRRLDILRTRLKAIESRGWARSRRRGQA